MMYEELIQALRETAKHLDGISRFPYDDDPAKRIYSKKMTDAAAAIEALQAQLPKRGEWLYGDKMPQFPRIPYKPWLRYCSECGEPTQQDDNALFDYCPNCGAKMEVQE